MLRAAATGVKWVEVTSTAGWGGVQHPYLLRLPQGSLLLLAGQGTHTNGVWKSDAGVSWTQVLFNAPFPARIASAAVALPDGSVLLMGGSDLSGGSVRYADVWLGTAQGATWTEVLTTAPWSGRTGHAACVLPETATVLLAGGQTAAGRQSDVWTTSNAGGNWTLLSGSHGWGARVHMELVALHGGVVVLAGGMVTWPTRLNDVWRSNDGGQTFVELALAPWAPRSQFEMVAFRSTIVVAGGTGSDDITPADVWRSTDLGDTWQMLTTSPGWVGRYWLAVAFAMDGSLVLVGGKAPPAHPVLGDVWRSASVPAGDWCGIMVTQGGTLRKLFRVSAVH